MLISLISTTTVLFISWKVFKKDQKNIEKIKTKMNWKNILIITSIAACFYIIIEFSLTVMNIAKYFPSYEGMTLLFKNSNIILLILYAVVIGPIVEELIFRGIVFNRLKEYNIKIWMAVIIQAVIFGIEHLNILQSIYAILVGILTAFIYQKEKTILAPIIIHMSYNLISVIIIQFANYEIPLPVFSVIFGLSVVSIIFLFSNYLKQKPLENV